MKRYARGHGEEEDEDADAEDEEDEVKGRREEVEKVSCNPRC